MSTCTFGTFFELGAYRDLATEDWVSDIEIDGKLAGIGGFANITQTTRKVVFCFSFTAGGLEIEDCYGEVSIVEEGRIPKFVEQVDAISFSAQNAHDNGQEALYVTERCVFRLGADGLELVEVYPDIDVQADVLDKLPFDVAVAC